jgi:hypothetical protein
VRIALEIARLQDRVHDRTAIGTREAAAVVVEGQTELPLAAGQLERQRGRIEARIGRAERHGRTIGLIRHGHVAARQPAGQIHPVVDPQRGVTDPDLRGLRRVESGQDHSTFVGDTVPVGVLQIQDIGCAGDEYAAVPRQDAIGVPQAGREVRAPVVASVAVDILQPRNHAFGRRLNRRAFQRTRIAAIFDDEHAAALVERDRHRVSDQRLCGCELNPVFRLELKGGERLRRSQRPGALRAAALQRITAGERPRGRSRAQQHGHHQRRDASHGQRGTTAMKEPPSKPGYAREPTGSVTVPFEATPKTRMS